VRPCLENTPDPWKVLRWVLWLSIVLVAFCCCDKLRDINSLKEKDLFWITVSEVSVHGQLASLFLGLW
jgi:hypothetical protein